VASYRPVPTFARWIVDSCEGYNELSIGEFDYDGRTRLLAKHTTHFRVL
jgi:hypothetical protein